MSALSALIDASLSVKAGGETSTTTTESVEITFTAKVPTGALDIQLNAADLAHDFQAASAASGRHRLPVQGGGTGNPAGAARKDPSHWVFPKGHLEREEAALDAAVREVREAGVIGRVVLELGTQCFTSGVEAVHVRYFLMQAVREGGESETRGKQWTRPPPRSAL